MASTTRRAVAVPPVLGNAKRNVTAFPQRSDCRV